MALDRNRDGRLAMMEHEAGIERVTGHGLKSERGYGSGRGLGFGYQHIEDIVQFETYPAPCIFLGTKQKP